jgi:hypothetical protein
MKPQRRKSVINIWHKEWSDLSTTVMTHKIQINHSKTKVFLQKMEICISFVCPGLSFHKPLTNKLHRKQTALTIAPKKNGLIIPCTGTANHTVIFLPIVVNHTKLMYEGYPESKDTTPIKFFKNIY